MKPQILVHTPNIRDATSFYRAWGPWSHLAKDIDLTYIDARDFDWHDVAAADILFIHRPYTNTHVAMLRAARRIGIPVWIDFDDDLFNVHHSNRNVHLYENKQTRDNIKLMLGEASHVTVSTAHLGAIYRPHTEKISVINNKLPEHLIGNKLVKEIKTLPRKVVLWRGTDHHDVNLQYYRSAFDKLMKQNPDWTFIFYGFKPWYLMELGKPGQSMHFADGKIIDYLHRLQDIQATIQVVPLIKDIFNSSKSSIAYLEAAGMAASTCILPDMPEWNKGQGVVVYEPNNVDAFSEATQRAIDMTTKQRMQFGNMARKYVQANHTLESVKKDRLEIIQKLCG